MKEASHWQFGLLIAYLLPGFIGLAGLAPLFPTVASWLRPVSQGDFELGPPLYAILAAITVGMIVSCFRWLLIDQIHLLTGVHAPALNYRALETQMTAFNYWVEQHYRYYQFYANTLIAVLWAYGVNRYFETSPLLGIGTDLGVLILCAVLFIGSRDTLMKYRKRAGQVVGHFAEKDFKGTAMTNGVDHKDGNATASSPRDNKAAEKPSATPKLEQDKSAKTPAAKSPN